MDENGWSVCKTSSRRRHRHRPISVPNSTSFQYTTKDVLQSSSSFKRTIETITHLMLTMPCTLFYKSFITKMKKSSCYDTEIIMEIVAYGLGSFTTSSNARYQLACILLYDQHKQKENDDLDLNLNLNKYIYDPIMSKEDECIACHFGFQLLKENDQGKRKVYKNTLFYMPHCGRQLYCNVLCSNWMQLQYITIFGNSFQQYDDRSMDSTVRKSCCILKVLSSTTEDPLFIDKSHSNYSGYYQAFSDTSIHTFSSNNNECCEQITLALMNIDLKKQDEI